MHKPKHTKHPKYSELAKCIRSRNTKSIQSILTANPELLNVVVEEENVLHVAMKAENPTETVDRLLDNIVEIGGLQEPDKEGYTPLDLAAQRGNSHVMHAFCGHGYDCTIVSPQVISLHNKSLLRALGEASNPDVDQIETLIKTGLSSDAIVIEAQNIIESGNHSCFETFAAKNLNGKKEVNNVLLMIAATQCAVEYQRQDHLSTMYMVEILLRMGADPNAKDEDGLDGLKVAATYGIKQLCKLFLKYGANPFTKARGGGTALSFARNHMVFMGKPHINVDYPATVEILKGEVYERIGTLRSEIDRRSVKSTAIAAVVTMFSTSLSLPKEILALLAGLIIK